MRQLKNFKSEDHKSEGTDAPDFSRYEGMSGDELMRELFRAVSSAKRDGSFSREQIDDFVGFISPNLDEATRARLNELVGMIDNG